MGDVDKINPQHYQNRSDDLQVIDVIEQFGLNFHRGNVVKYTIRAGRKSELGYEALEKAIEDLNKAKWYLDRQILDYQKQMEIGDGK